MTLSTFTKSALIAATASLLAGCASSGLSYREGGSQTQASYLGALVADLPQQELRTAKQMKRPADLAVAQIGEVSPPETMLAELRKANDLFATVQPIPATGGRSGYPYRYQSDASPNDAKAGIQSLINLAASSGADYLLLIGGTVDQTDRSTPLSVLNLTVIGAFIVPSHETQATMKASGAVIDVQSGQIVALTSADLQKSRLFTYASSDGDSMRMVQAMRDQVTKDLAGKVAEHCRSVAVANGSSSPSIQTAAGR